MPIATLTASGPSGTVAAVLMFGAALAVGGGAKVLNVHGGVDPSTGDENGRMGHSGISTQMTVPRAFGLVLISLVSTAMADAPSDNGQNGIDEGLIPYCGVSAYDDPDIYAKSSPITFVKQVHTPMLIVVGDSDVECPSLKKAVKTCRATGSTRALTSPQFCVLRYQRSMVMKRFL